MSKDDDVLSMIRTPDGDACLRSRPDGKWDWEAYSADEVLDPALGVGTAKTYAEAALAAGIRIGMNKSRQDALRGVRALSQNERTAS